MKQSDLGKSPDPTVLRLRMRLRGSLVSSCMQMNCMTLHCMQDMHGGHAQGNLALATLIYNPSLEGICTYLKSAVPKFG
jgi:hypothetical protein